MRRGFKLSETPLEMLVLLSDSGTWGDDAPPGDGDPVLRSTNIDDFRMSLADPAWRRIPPNDVERKRLATGDIIVTKSSGSPDHIGKCAMFIDPDDGERYYFSNFMLRLRANPDRIHPAWLFHWLSSPRGRFELGRLNNTTSGLRNLSVPRYLQQLVPVPPLDVQAEVVARLNSVAELEGLHMRAAQRSRDLRDALVRRTLQGVW